MAELLSGVIHIVEHAAHELLELAINLFERPAEVLGVLAHFQAGHQHATGVCSLARHEGHAVCLEVLGCVKCGGHVRALADHLAAVGNKRLGVFEVQRVLASAGKRDVAGQLPHATAVLGMPRCVRALVNVHGQGDTLVMTGALLVVNVLEHRVVDAVGVFDPALGVGAGQHLTAKLRNLLDGVNGNVTGAVHDHVLALEAVAVGLQVLVNKVHQAVTGCLGAGKRAAEGQALAGEHAGPFVADALVLTEHVANLAAAYAQVTGGNVGVRANVTAKLGHEGLAEVHDFVVGLALRVEVGAALAAAHGQGGQGVLEDLLKAQELQHAKRYRGVEAQTALVGADGRVVFNAETAVDLNLTGVVDPRDTELDDAFGFDDALKQGSLLEFRMCIECRLQGAQNFRGSLNELGLVGVLRLHLLDDALSIAHCVNLLERCVLILTMCIIGVAIRGKRYVNEAETLHRNVRQTGPFRTQAVHDGCLELACSAHRAFVSAYNPIFAKAKYAKRGLNHMSKFVDTKLTARELLPLIGVTVSAFIFNTSEFMPVGLLTDIGATFATSEGVTGLIISVYAWAVMLLSLPLMILGSRLAFRPLLLLVTGVFCAGQALSAISVSYGMLMCSRLVVACAHSVFWAIAAPIAVKVVDERHAPMAVSAVVTGSALAMIVGLPLGRAIGLVFGWRLTFACVGAISAAVLVYLAVVFPKIATAKPFSLAQLPDIMRNKALMGIFIVTALYAMGYYTGYSYIEPFLLQIGGMDENVVTLALVAFGVAGVCGSVVCSRFYRTHRRAFAIAVVAGVALALALLRPSVVSIVFVFAVCALWGIAGSSYSIVYQAEIIEFASEGEQTVAMAIFSGIFNLGIGTGSFIGGGVCTFSSVGNVGFVGAFIALCGLAYCALVLVKHMKACGVK